MVSPVNQKGTVLVDPARHPKDVLLAEPPLRGSKTYKNSWVLILERVNDLSILQLVIYSHV